MSDSQEKNKPTLLIVDDSPVTIKALSEILKDEYRVLGAASGKKGIEIACGNNPPDLILLDIIMPEMDGYEICHKLKSDELTKKIPVIFVTSRSEPEEEEKGFLIGASDYIIKPFKPAVVRVRVRNQINSNMYLKMVEAHAREDTLTGIANRRIYDEMFVKIWKQCVREEEYISLIMIDADYFKLYNDHYGHGAGDECLRKIAQVLKTSANRPFDIAARYGGEEFAIILLNTDLDGAQFIADKIIRSIRDLKIPHEYSSAAPVVTVSAGFASIKPTRSDSPEEFAQCADRALYKAKSAGRNNCKAWIETSED